MIFIQRRHVLERNGYQMNVALTHVISPNIAQCELSFIERSPIDYERAVQQHEAYCTLLRECGLDVIELSENSSFPDSTFVEDTAVVVDEIAVMTSMGVESRRGEVPAIESALSTYRPIDRILPPATLEGGDVLRSGKKIFVGVTPRTNTAGVDSLIAILKPFGYSIIPVPVRGCLHLKSACTLIDAETLLINPHWINPGIFEGFRIITVSEIEPWAANALLINTWVCMHAGFSRTLESLNNLGFRIKTVDISELLKAEAGMTCSSLIVKNVL
jgi:dimethylargininase